MDSRTTPAASTPPVDTLTRTYREALAGRLELRRGSALEKARIETELAQMLRDEAEAEGVDSQDGAQVKEWVAAQEGRLADLARELEKDILRQTPAPSPGRPDAVGSSSSLAAALQGLFADVKIAVRTLGKRPGMTAVILATLTLGIGLNSAVFSVLNSALLRPAAVTDSDSLVKLFTTIPNGFLPEEPMAFPDAVDMRRAESIEDVAVQAMTFSALSQDEGAAEVVVAEMASDNLFELLGVKPRLGRLFQSSGGEGNSGLIGNEGDVAVLSAATWKRRFGSSPDVLGRVVRLNGYPLEIIGVAPSGYRGVARGLEPEMWVPVDVALRGGLTPSTNSGSASGAPLTEDRGRRSWWVVARVADGFTPAQAMAELDTVAQALQTEYPDTNENRSLRVLAYDKVKVIPAIDSSINTATWVLLGVVFLVLLIASTNLANLLLARAIGRRSEMATRLSLGASRGVIVRQLMVESLVLGLLGAIGGLGVAYVVSETVSRLRLELMVPLQMTVDLDFRVVAFTVGVSLITALIFGLAPAFEASRTNLTDSMKESSNRGGRRMRLQSTLVTAQVAFSVVLLIFAGLAIRSVANGVNIDRGFEAEGRAGLIISPSSQGYERDERANFYRQLVSDLSARPEVEAVSIMSHVPLNMTINTTDIVPVRQAGDDPDTWPEIDIASVDENYFDLLGIPLLRGRTFELADRQRTTRSVIINQTLAEMFWPEEDAIGQRLVDFPGEDPFEVVGVVGNGRYRTLGEAPRPFLYYALSEGPSMVAVLAKFRGGETSFLPVQQAVRDLDPVLAVTGAGTLDEMTSTSLLIPKAAVTVFGLLGLIGLVISSVGLFGVLAYSVSQRTHEIGLRVAVGATASDVVKLVLRRGLFLAGVGIAFGTGVAFLSTRFLSAMLYGISATDAMSFLGGTSVLLVVAVVATLVPARSALKVSPTQALRYQ